MFFGAIWYGMAMMTRCAGPIILGLLVCLSGCGAGSNPDRSHISVSLEKHFGKAEADKRMKEMDARYGKISSVRKPTFWKDMRSAVESELAPLIAAEKKSQDELKKIDEAASSKVVESSEIPGILKNGKGYKPSAVGLKHKGEIIGMVEFHKPEKGWSNRLTLTLKKQNEEYKDYPDMVGYNGKNAQWEAYNGHAVPGMKCKIGKLEFFVEQSRRHMTVWQ